MFSDEELAVFLALLRQFVSDSRMSALGCAKLFGVSAPTMARWVRQSLIEGEPTMTVYRFNAQPVSDIITKLNNINAAMSGALYAEARTAKVADRVALLNRAIHANK